MDLLPCSPAAAPAAAAAEGEALLFGAHRGTCTSPAMINIYTQID